MQFAGKVQRVGLFQPEVAVCILDVQDGLWAGTKGTVVETGDAGRVVVEVRGVAENGGGSSSGERPLPWQQKVGGGK